VINGCKVLALVPARYGSKGLPLKNIRPLNGKPLLAWPVQSALASRFVDRVVVSTDSEEFAAIARAAGADVPFLRPPEFATDTSASIDVILHAIDTLACNRDYYDYLILLEPTSPLTEARDIDLALEKLSVLSSQADSIVGVSAMISDHPAYAVRVGTEGLMRPYAAAQFGEMPRRQVIEPLFSLDGSLYASTVEALRRKRGFYHDRTLPYFTPRHKSFEIDDLIDFICVEAILSNRHLIERSEQTSRVG
jgi:CMP-N,N'-diacetyllegionaminic acid synthase